MAYPSPPAELALASGSPWVIFSNSTTPLNYVAGSLGYAGLPASLGNKIEVLGLASADDDELPFTGQTTVYASFLLKVTALPSTQDYPIALRDGAYRGRVHVVTSGSNFELGVSKGATSPEAQTSMGLSVGTTYLVVLKYVVDIPGSDTFSLWVNPVLGGSETGANAVAVGGTDSTASIGSFALRQNAGAGTVEVDEIRVGTAWADVTPLASAADDPDASFLPSSLAFGAIAREATKDLSVKVLNAGTSSANLDITSVAFGGLDPARFSVVSSLPVSGIAPGTSTTLTFRYDPAGLNGADHNATATLVCNDPNPPIITLSGSSYLDVANLAAARAAALGVPIRVTGVVTVVSPTNGLNQGGNRHQLVVQDASGVDGQTGLFVDDPSYALATDYVVGDQLQNLAGSLTDYLGLLELVPSATATQTGSGATVTPLVLTGAESLDAIESELIRLNTVSVTTTDLTWVYGTTGKNYTLDAAVGPISVLRVEEGSGVVGQPVPAGNFDVIGIAGEFSTAGQIFPRFAADIISPASSVSEWMLIR